jgi:hypothetical protein
MALSDVEVRAALRDAFQFWRDDLETRQMAFERIPEGSAAPLILM